jgi:hypothetical protein
MFLVLCLFNFYAKRHSLFAPQNKPFRVRPNSHLSRAWISREKPTKPYLRQKIVWKQLRRFERSGSRYSRGNEPVAYVSRFYIRNSIPIQTDIITRQDGGEGRCYIPALVPDNENLLLKLDDKPAGMAGMLGRFARVGIPSPSRLTSRSRIIILKRANRPPLVAPALPGATEAGPALPSLKAFSDCWPQSTRIARYGLSSAASIRPR